MCSKHFFQSKNSMSYVMQWSFLLNIWSFPINDPRFTDSARIKRLCEVKWHYFWSNTYKLGKFVLFFILKYSKLTGGIYQLIEQINRIFYLKPYDSKRLDSTVGNKGEYISIFWFTYNLLLNIITYLIC